MNTTIQKVFVTIAMIIGCILWTRVEAQELRLGVHTVSHHTVGTYFDHEKLSTQTYNNVNPGMYVTKSDFTVGFYKNSVSRLTVYGAWTPSINVYGPVDAGFAIGLGTGYSKAFGRGFGPLYPVGGLTLAAHLNEKVTTRLMYVPSFEKGAAAVFHLTFETPLNIMD
jgi:hypothetical protein